METTMDAPATGGYTRQVGMGEAVRLFFSNYINFEGRSNRGEYWWAVLAMVLISLGLSAIDAMLGIGLLGAIFSLATLVPGIAIGVRRLHDIDRTGWWMLLLFIPVIGFLVLIYFFVQPPNPGPNRFG